MKRKIEACLTETINNKGRTNVQNVYADIFQSIFGSERTQPVIRAQFVNILASLANTIKVLFSFVKTHEWQSKLKRNVLLTIFLHLFPKTSHVINFKRIHWNCTVDCIFLLVVILYRTNHIGQYSMASKSPPVQSKSKTNDYRLFSCLFHFKVATNQIFSLHMLQ